MARDPAMNRSYGDPNARSGGGRTRSVLAPWAGIEGPVSSAETASGRRSTQLGPGVRTAGSCRGEAVHCRAPLEGGTQGGPDSPEYRSAPLTSG